MFADVFSWEFLINELQNVSSLRNIQSCAPRAVLCQINCQDFVVEAKRTGSLYKMLPSLQKLPMEHLVVVLSSIKNRILQCRFSVLSKQKNGPKTILAPRSMKTFQPTPQTSSNNTPETFENGIRKSKCRNVESSTKHIQTSFFGIQFNHTKMSEPYKQYFAFCQRLSDKHKTAHFQPRLAPFSPQFMEMEPVIPNTGASLSVGNRHRQFHCKSRLDQNWYNGICMS